MEKLQTEERLETRNGIEAEIQIKSGTESKNEGRIQHFEESFEVDLESSDLQNEHYCILKEYFSETKEDCV